VTTMPSTSGWSSITVWIFSTSSSHAEGDISVDDAAAQDDHNGHAIE
jgi:hypothetical protein